MSSKLGRQVLRREEYKKVKKMDRQQFEAFCRALFEEGQKSVEQSQSGIDISEVRAVLLEVKGIGEKRADQIIEKLTERLDEKHE